MRGTTSAWREILPPTAQTNLQLIEQLPQVAEARKYNEIATNLDQCPDHQEHVGVRIPTILASISHMQHDQMRCGSGPRLRWTVQLVEKHVYVISLFKTFHGFFGGVPIVRQRVKRGKKLPCGATQCGNLGMH